MNVLSSFVVIVSKYIIFYNSKYHLATLVTAWTISYNQCRRLGVSAFYSKLCPVFVHICDCDIVLLGSSTLPVKLFHSQTQNKNSFCCLCEFCPVWLSLIMNCRVLTFRRDQHIKVILWVQEQKPFYFVYAIFSLCTKEEMLVRGSRDLMDFASLSLSLCLHEDSWHFYNILCKSFSFFLDHNIES